MDFNQIYFQHQLLLLKAQQACSSGERRGLRSAASVLAGRIGRSQSLVGAGAAPRWHALAGAPQ
jgi:hypothetical protein